MNKNGTDARKKKRKNPGVKTMKINRTNVKILIKF